MTKRSDYRELVEKYLMNADTTSIITQWANSGYSDTEFLDLMKEQRRAAVRYASSDLDELCECSDCADSEDPCRMDDLECECAGCEDERAAQDEIEFESKCAMGAV
jgi:hypothetical protein